MKIRVLFCLLTLATTGCNVPRNTSQPSNWSPVNKVAANIAGKSIPTDISKRIIENQVPKLPTKITIQDALTQYVPKAYKVTTASDVNINALISYDRSTPWMEALGKSFENAGIEVEVNMYKKRLFIRPFQVSLLEVVEQYIPAEYTVFIDPAIDENRQISYNTSQHWIDAMSNGGTNANMDITANITKKIVSIKPLVTTNADTVASTIPPIAISREK